MPSKTWGPSVSTSSGATLTLAYDSITRTGSTAKLVNPRIEFYSKSGWSDTANTIKATGSAVVAQTWSNNTLNGGTKTFACTASPVALSYGSTTPATFTAAVTGVSFFNGDSTTTTYTLNVDMPAIPYDLPVAPASVTASGQSDTQATVSWSYNGTSSAPWDNVHVVRWDTAKAAWYEVATLAWNVQTFTDTTLQADREYRYRVFATNSSGAGPATAAPASVYTTPAAHASLTWAKSGADVVLTWTTTTTLAASTEVQESTDNGQTWTVKAAAIAAGTTTWTHTAPSNTTPHLYRVRPTIGGKTGAWTTSTAVVLLAAPKAPTALTPTGTVDPAGGVTAEWRHNPVDGTDQTAFELQWKYSDASAWTTATGGAGFFTWPTLTRAQTVVFQVRTKGAHADYSPWSDPQAFTTGTRPTSTVSTPDGTPYGTADLAVAWAYYDAEGTPSAASRVTLTRDADAVTVWTASLPGGRSSANCPVPLTDQTAYTLTVTDQDGSGLWSNPAVVHFSTSFVPPPTPLVATSWDDTLGAGVVTITNPDLTDGTVPAVSNQVWRTIGDGRVELIADRVPLNGTILDRTALSHGTTTYTVVAWSATPTSVRSAPAPLTVASCYVWLTGGPGNSVMARLKGNPAVSATKGRPKVLHQFVGRRHPVEFIGAARTAVYKLSGDVDGYGREADELGPWTAWEDIADLPAPLIYRDPLGRWLPVSVSDVEVSHDAQRTRAHVSVTLTVVDHA